MALSRARDLFWSLGYQRASLPELERATGLQRGSLYALFADKRELFLEALALYGENTLKVMDAAMPPGATRADILGWITAHAAGAHGPAGVRGCLLVETTMEMGPHDAAIADRSAGLFAAMLKRLEAALAGAPDLQLRDPVATARTILASLEGLRVLGKAGQSEQDVAGAIAVMATMLIPPGEAR